MRPPGSVRAPELALPGLVWFNTPAPLSNADETGGAVLPTSPGQPPTRTSELANYEVSRVTRHTVSPSGQVARLSVAVLVDDDRTGPLGADGKAPAPKEGASTPKPKWVFHTEHGADIIVQSKRARLSLDDRIAALQEALEQAKVNQVILSRFETV